MCGGEVDDERIFTDVVWEHCLGCSHDLACFGGVRSSEQRRVPTQRRRVDANAKNRGFGRVVPLAADATVQVGDD